VIVVPLVPPDGPLISCTHCTALGGTGGCLPLAGLPVAATPWQPLLRLCLNAPIKLLIHAQSSGIQSASTP
jgi:hypothetical protein